MPSVILEIDAAPKFAFLALPPPPKKKRAAVNNAFRAPVSPVNRSKTILAWAETVHPGSPVPMTPASGVFLPRRPSAGSTRSRIPSASFLHFSDTPRTPAHPIPATPFPADAKFDLTAFGYSSVFVDVAVSTPMTPDLYKPKPMARLPSHQHTTVGSAPASPATKSTGMFKRLLGNKSKPAKLQARAQKTKGERDVVNPALSDYVSVSLKKRSKYTEQPSSGVEKKKRGVYAAVLPPTVKQEAQMRQAMEGGSLEYNIQKVMEEKAKREGTAVKVYSTEGAKVVEGVDTAHRDAKGGMWWDQEEEWEFAHLLAANNLPVSARCMDSDGWVSFDNLKVKKEADQDDFTDLASLPSSKCTDLYHVRPLLILDDSIQQLVRGHTKRSSSVVGSIALPSPSTKSSKIILAIPSRPTRTKHLLQPTFLNDVVAVPPTPSSTSAYSQTSFHPRSPGRVTRFVVRSSSTPGSVRRQRSRSRSVSKKQRKPVPPPLKIVPGPVTKLAVNVEPEDEGRRLFLEDSFNPDPTIANSRWSRDTTAPVSRLPLTKSDSDESINHFALVPVPQKSRGLGGLFKKSQRK